MTQLLRPAAAVLLLAVPLPNIAPGLSLLTLEVGEARLTTRLAKE